MRDDRVRMSPSTKVAGWRDGEGGRKGGSGALKDNGRQL